MGGRGASQSPRHHASIRPPAGISVPFEKILNNPKGPRMVHPIVCTSSNKSHSISGDENDKKKRGIQEVAQLCR